MTTGSPRTLHELIASWRSRRLAYRKHSQDNLAKPGNLEHSIRLDIQANILRQCADALEAHLASAAPADEDHLDIYVPGVLRCLKCQFELTTATLFVQSGNIGMTRDQALVKHEGEPCPNDGTPMVKVRWAERAQQNYEAYGALMNEIIGIAGLSRQCDNLPSALEILRSASQVPAAQKE